MRKYLYGIVGSLMLAFLVVGCSDYVQSVDKPIDSASDQELNSAADITPFIRGLQQRFALVHPESSLNNGGIADEMFYSSAVRGATFPQYRQMDDGRTTILVPANNSVQNAWQNLTQYRFLADNLVDRCTSIKAALDPTDPDFASNSAQADEGIFQGRLHGAIARGFMADHWALVNTGPGGGVLDATTLGSGNSQFISASEMRQAAQALLSVAAAEAPSPNLAATCWTISARMHLYEGNFAAAATAANQGMASGVPALEAQPNEATRNEWYDAAGFGRDQFMADFRFKGYVDADPSEAGRIPLAIRIGNDGTEFWQQNKYSEFDSPVAYVTWQENSLILAELAIRNSDNPTALTFINAVRASHGVSDMTDEIVQADFEGDYLSMIYTERDKEFCFTGLRGMDQIRFNKWHKEDESIVWKWMPISQQERNGNPNFD